MVKARADYQPLGFKLNYKTAILGLLAVKLLKVSGESSSYKIFEKVGGFDVTPIYGPLIDSA